ncbi:MAG: 2TM domain-containing protein [Hyphomicrobiaceae bacterium]
MARAERKVQAMTGFCPSLTTFGIVMMLLFALNFTDPHWWVQWPLVGWGVGLVAHWYAVFGHGAEKLQRWQLKKIYELKSQM